jgi:hypothetical protein
MLKCTVPRLRYNPCLLTRHRRVRLIIVDFFETTAYMVLTPPRTFGVVAE